LKKIKLMMKKVYSVLTIVFLVIFLFGCKSNRHKESENKLPNIIFIIGDDVGVYDLGCYGNEGIKTPNIDNLASEGLRFDNAFLTVSSCSPSRCSIITGRYPHNTGAAELHSPLPANQVLFPEVLKAHGYYTAQAGKWHFGSVPMVKTKNVDTASLGPAVRAFDRISVRFQDNGDGGEDMWIKFLKERPKDKPFFMWFAPYDSHRPWGPNELGNKNNNKDVWVPEFLYDGDMTRNDLRLYYNEITRLDFYLGEIEKELKKQNVADNTIIIFTSDNGRPFPRSKTRVYDSGIKTPLIIKWPEGIQKRGFSVHALVSTVDIAPTILKIAGIIPGNTFQGRSFAELFKKPDTLFRHYVFAEHNWHDYEACERMVRTIEYLYLENFRPQFDAWGPADAVGSPSMKELYEAYTANKINRYQRDIFIKPRPAEELFNTVKDPYQYFNLANDTKFKKIKERLKKVLETWRKETGDNCPDYLTPDHFDRKTGKRLFEGFKWGEMPGKALGADTITNKGPF
jgi:arylsulfatase A-like enzyme